MDFSFYFYSRDKSKVYYERRILYMLRDIKNIADKWGLRGWERAIYYTIGPIIYIIAYVIGYVRELIYGI